MVDYLWLFTRLYGDIPPILLIGRGHFRFFLCAIFGATVKQGHGVAKLKIRHRIGHSPLEGGARKPISDILSRFAIGAFLLLFPH